MAAKNLVKKHTKQAEQWLKKGQLDKARAAYFEAAKLDSNNPTLWASFGSISLQLKQAQDSLAAFKRATMLAPNTPGYYLHLGKAHEMQKNYGAAKQDYDTYTKMMPNAPEGYHALALLAHKCGALAKAINYYQQAISHAPTDEKLLLELGTLQRIFGRYDDSLKTYQTAIQLHPKSWDVHQGLGTLYTDMRDIDQAIKTFKHAYSLHPKRQLDFYLNLIATHYEYGSWSQALEYCDKALTMSPGHIHTRMLRAYLLLALGRWNEGWAEYEVRLQHGEWRGKHLAPLVKAPLWQGETLPDATILVEEDQGYGDSMHFCRYIALLAERCKKVVVRCRPALQELMKTVPGVAEIIPVTQASANMPIDRYVYMMSLPHLIGPGENKLYTPPPYLKADAALVEKFKPRFADDNNFKVGIAWEGSLTHGKNAIRSIPLELFEPLADLEGISFYSLQKRSADSEIEKTDLPMIDLSDELHDFSHTAAIVEHLDLVISVDTAVAHLAGGMGKETWTLLYYPPEWRWQAAGETTPWYPTMRLFRQSTERDWSCVIDEVKTALVKHIIT